MNRTPRLLAATATVGALLGWSLSRTVTGNSYKTRLTALAAEREKLERSLAREERATRSVRHQRDYAHLLLRKARQQAMLPDALNLAIGIAVPPVTDEETARAEQVARDMRLPETPFPSGKFLPPALTLFPRHLFPVVPSNLFPAEWLEQHRQAMRAFAPVFASGARSASTSKEGT